jgi:hypothetical protein
MDKEGVSPSNITPYYTIILKRQEEEAKASKYIMTFYLFIELFILTKRKFITLKGPEKLTLLNIFGLVKNKEFKNNQTQMFFTP